MSTANRFALALVVAAAIAAVPSAVPAQERKPVPKDSVRVAVPGCTKGYIFTAGRRTVDEPGVFEIPEGMHLRMNGPKKLIAEIKAHEGSMIELVGLMKKSQYKEGVDIGGGVRVSGAGSPSSGGSRMGAYLGPSQPQIDVEGWRPLDGGCKT